MEQIYKKNNIRKRLQALQHKTKTLTITYLCRILFNRKQKQHIMALIQNLWNNVIDWFQEHRSRNELVRNFNRSAQNAFVNGEVPVMLKASIVGGHPPYRHRFSKMIGSGFQIQAYSGRQLTKQEIITIGDTILSNDMLVRRMVVLGWDTLKIHCDVGQYGCQWQLHDFMMLGQ